MIAALVLAPGLVAVPAWAAGPAWGAVTTTSFDQAEEDRIYVRWLAGYETRSLVRTAAWNALTSSNVPATVDRFLYGGGMDYAITRSRQLAARNADFARRILATHTVQFSPEVHAAAEYALLKGGTILEGFVRTGYAAAKERDRVAREADGAQEAALLQTDRDFVAHLRDTDPGPQVQAAAGYALRVGATDADIVEFYAYDWAAAAAVDLETQQLQCANSDLVWRARVKTLRAEAVAAQQAAEQAAGEAREQARAAAARAWHALGEQAVPAKSTWDTAAEVAERQAANWQQVALAAAAAAENPNWDAIALGAQTNQEQWDAARVTAAKQAAYWAALYQEALAGELAMQS
ncbi:hypothetical protein AB0J83_39265 [Actinoplanes sp. NPDC049596]|uniref:hypothetical protein n=1 Tax=unclassified Actinoplanes TaxID=2626549 RepID=UPI0034283C7B